MVKITINNPPDHFYRWYGHYSPDGWFIIVYLKTSEKQMIFHCQVIRLQECSWMILHRKRHFRTLRGHAPLPGLVMTNIAIEHSLRNS